jgi:hypothetical protein
MSSKIVMYNTPLPNEVILHQGVKSKLKLAIKYIDNKLEKTVSNMDNIAIKYHDKSKRKFV